MISYFLSFCIILVGAIPALAFDMSGVSVGDQIKRVPNIEGKVIAQNRLGPFTARRYKLNDGNDLSITFNPKTGRILYTETDWGGQSSGAFSDYPGFIFGKTTLDDIRSKLESNGFTYTNHAFFKDDDGNAIFFNSFESTRKPKIIVTFGTKLAASRIREFLEHKITTGAAVLDALIYADPDYVDTTWGKRTAPDPAYRPID